MSRSTLARLAVALALVIGACSPATPQPSPIPSAGAGPSTAPVVASANPCAAPIAHLAAFANRLTDQIAALRPLVTDPAFDSAATAAGIRGISGTLTAYIGLEERLASCPATAPIAEAVATVRSEARESIDASTKVSIQDQITQRAVAAALFGLLPAVEEIATATRAAAAAAGIDTDVAVLPDASAEPIGSLPPLATPTPGSAGQPPSTVTTYEAAFFGPNTTVKTYRVFGSTPLEIVESMLARGPRNNWLNERAEAVTLAVPEIRVELVGSGSACHVVARANPAVSFRFTITLPRWEPPSAASRTTVTWWNAELGRAATHEHHHVDLWRAAGTRLSRAATTSTCANLQSRLAAIVKATARENCEFDMDEYGKALGLSLDDCLGG